jgi:hypothetical protein
VAGGMIVVIGEDAAIPGIGPVIPGESGLDVVGFKEDREAKGLTVENDRKGTIGEFPGIL